MALLKWHIKKPFNITQDEDLSLTTSVSIWKTRIRYQAAGYIDLVFLQAMTFDIHNLNILNEIIHLFWQNFMYMHVPLTHIMAPLLCDQPSLDHVFISQQVSLQCIWSLEKSTFFSTHLAGKTQGFIRLQLTITSARVFPESFAMVSNWKWKSFH